MDLNKVIGGLANSGFLSGMAGGALSSALMSKKGRKHATTALQVGGIAALGGVAWKAYQNYQSQQSQTPRTGTAGTPGLVSELSARAPSDWHQLNENQFQVDETEAASDSNGVLLIQAMVAAANADGHIDRDERERIMNRVQTLCLAAEERAMVFDTMASPLSLSDVCARVTCPETATQVYLASLIALDQTRPAAQLYLDALAFRLGLPPELAEQLHRSIEAPMVQVA